MDKRKNGKSKFNIIDAVLALAIVSVVLLMIFLAVPAIRRSQQDERRKADLMRLATAVEQFQKSNNGWVPSDDELFVVNYLDNDFVGPDGEKYTIDFGESGHLLSQIEAEFDDEEEGAESMQQESAADVVIYAYSKCAENGESVEAAAGSRAYAVTMKLEKGEYCIDNS